MPHVSQIQGNSQGCDYIISDPHGSCLAEFKKFYNGLKPGDRVFIGGDIGDRGQQSRQWYNYIALIANTPGAVPISCIRGNHEDLIIRTSRCLSNLEALAQGPGSDAFQNLAKDPSTRFLTELDDVKRNAFLASCQEMIRAVKGIPLDEVVEVGHDVVQQFAKELFQKEKNTSLQAWLHDFLVGMGNGGNWLTHIDSTEREVICQQIESWPYVILVDEGHPAGWVVEEGVQEARRPLASPGPGVLPTYRR